MAITRREREIVRLVVEGWTGPQISKQLGISLKTVRRHIENIGEKLREQEASELTPLRLIRKRAGGFLAA